MKKNLLLICIAGLSLIYIIIFSNFFNLKISPDSVIYIEGAKRLHNSLSYSTLFARQLWEGPRDEKQTAQTLIEELEKPQKKPISPFPPATSAVYALSLFFGNNILTNISIINGLAFIAFMAGFAWLVFYSSSSLTLTIGSIFYIFFTFPFVEKYTWAWSEPLFVLVMLGSFATLMKFLETNQKKYFILSIIFTLLAYITRLQGIAVILAGTFAILVHNHKKWKTALIYLLSSSAVFLVIFIYRKMLGADSGYFFHSSAQNIKDAFFIGWDFIKNSVNYYILSPAALSSGIQKGISWLIMAFMGVYITISLIYARNTKFFAALLYTVFLSVITIGAIVFLNIIGPLRYQMPIYPFLILAFLFPLKNITNSIVAPPRRGVNCLASSRLAGLGLIARKILTVILISIFAITVPLKIDYFLEQIKTAAASNYQHPMDINNEKSEQKQLLAHVKKIVSGTPNAAVFSNDSKIAYSALFYHDITILPLPYTMEGLSKLLEKVQQRPVYIIWEENYAGLPILDISSKKVISIAYSEQELKKYRFIPQKKFGDTYVWYYYFR